MNYFQALSHALRSLGRRKMFSAMALLTLALAIGANVTIYALINAFLLRPLPFRAPDRLVQVWATDRNIGTSKSRVSLPTFLDWAERTDSFESLSAHFYRTYVLSAGDRPVSVTAGRVSTNLLTTLGVEPSLGHGFEKPERLGEGRDVLLSYGLWRRAFAGDPGIIGRNIRLDDEPYQVVGVMPPGFEFPMNRVQLWLPLEVDSAQLPRDRPIFEVVGRLTRGVSRNQAQAELDGVSAALAQSYEEEDGRGVNVVPLREALIFYFDLVRMMLIAIAVTGGLLLVVACLNVGAGIVARTVQRTREIGIRMALGGGHGTVLRGLLLEAACLAAFGAMGGVLLGYWGAKILDGWIPQDLYRVGEIGLDASVLVYSAVIAFLATLFLGLLPARHVLKLPLQQALREGEVGGGAFAHHRLRNVLVVGQVAAGAALLIGAAFMVRSLVALNRVDPGFDSDSLLAIQMSVPEASHPDLREAQSFYRNLLSDIRSVPTVEGAAMATLLPLNFETDFVEIAPRDSVDVREDRRPAVVENRVSPGYFRTLNVPLLRGRSFLDSDDLDSPTVVVVNRTLAEQTWGTTEVVGKSLHLYGAWEVDVQVVGVVADFKHKELRGPATPQLYRCLFQTPHRATSVLVRTISDPRTAVAPIRDRIWELDHQIPLDFTIYDMIIRQNLSMPTILASLLSTFGLVALVLAVVGTYGLVWSSVSERLHEIGVRMALGANGGDILGLVVKRGLRLAALGLVIGLPGGYAVARGLASFLVGVRAEDPLTFLGIAALVLIVAFGASYLPARNATRIDPVESLRSE